MTSERMIGVPTTVQWEAEEPFRWSEGSEHEMRGDEVQVLLVGYGYGWWQEGRKEAWFGILQRAATATAPLDNFGSASPDGRQSK